MNDTVLNKHRLHNYLTRLRSILECIEKNGDEFVTNEVSTDIAEAIDFIRTEFDKVLKGQENE